MQLLTRENGKPHSGVNLSFLKDIGTLDVGGKVGRIYLFAEIIVKSTLVIW